MLAVRQIKVSMDSLPVACPPERQEGWDKHPRVFLSLSLQQPRQACPYCGALYVLDLSPDNEEQ